MQIKFLIKAFPCLKSLNAVQFFSQFNRALISKKDDRRIVDELNY